MALVDNLVAYYSLEDLTDATGGGRALTNNSAVTFTAGKISNAATSAAVNANYLYRNDAYGLTNTAAYSISFWLKVNTDPTTDYDIFSKVINGPSGNTGQIARMVYEYNGGSRRLRFYQNTLAGTTFFDISGNIGDGTWHHYVIIFSGTAISLYKDNSAAFSGVSNDGQVNTSFTSRIDILDTQPSGYSAGINGQIDEFGIWSRAITAGEVSSLYNGGSALSYTGITGGGGGAAFVPQVSFVL